MIAGPWLAGKTRSTPCCPSIEFGKFHSYSADGHAPAQVAPVLESLRDDFNMLGRPRDERGDWVWDLGLKDLSKEQAPCLFFAGCRYSFDGDPSHVAKPCWYCTWTS